MVTISLRAKLNWGLLFVSFFWACSDGDPTTISSVDADLEIVQDSTADGIVDQTEDPLADRAVEASEDASPDLPGEPDTSPDLPSELDTSPDLPGELDTSPDLPGELDLAPNNPPAPTAPNIDTFKNVDATSQIVHNDPDPSDTQLFEITTEPANGDAVVSDAGLVTYSPNAGYVGLDELVVTVTDSATATGFVTISVTVGNRPPVPTAPPIELFVGESGTSQLVPNDPDPEETFTYEIIVQPERGMAEISETGLLTYHSEPNGLGSMTATIQVTDQSDAIGDVVVDITVYMAPAGPPGPLPEELCDSGENRLSLVSINPPQGDILTAGETVVFEAVVSYQVAVPWEVTLEFTGAQTLTSSVGVGCGETTVSGSVDVPDEEGVNGFSVDLDDTDYSIFYAIDEAEAISLLRFDTVSYPFNVPITQPQFEILATVSFDLYDSLGIDGPYVQITELTGVGGYHAALNPLSPTEGRPVRLLGTLNCHDTYVAFEMATNSSDSRSEGHEYITWPAVPPPISVNNWTTHIPVNSSELTVINLNVEDCVGGRGVTIEVPEEYSAWLSVLPADFVTFGWLSVTVNGAELLVGEETFGFIIITAGEGEDADVLELPVSAVRHDFDFSAEDWTVLNLCDEDDAYGTITLDEWTFPFAGVEISDIHPTTNAMIGLGDSCISDNLESYLNPTDFFDEVDPEYFGCPLLKSNSPMALTGCAFTPAYEFDRRPKLTSSLPIHSGQFPPNARGPALIC